METLEIVKTGKEVKASNKDLEALYEKCFPVVARFVKRMGGGLDDAKDIFHDALVIYMEMNHREHLLNRNGYILGIAKHLWMRKFRVGAERVSLSETELQIRIPDDYDVPVKTQKLLMYLERAGKKCMDLLHAFYYRQQRMQTIVKSLGFANEHSASVQKYKCLEKVREMVKQKSLAYEDFVE
jgi:DNA-directed RNA polymerase specialized sigma24 family protein